MRRFDHVTRDTEIGNQPSVRVSNGKGKLRSPHVLEQHRCGRTIVGKLFRCLVCIDLEAQSFATAWVEDAVRKMRLYSTEMADALQAAGW